MMPEEIRIGEDNICPITKLPCDDECCPSNAICNISGDPDIIAPAPIKLMGSSFNINNHCGITSETLHGAMDQHAMNIAILFAEFINKEQKYNGLHGGDEYGWYYDHLSADGMIHEFIGDTNDLYQIFLNQLTNGNNENNTLS